MNIGQLLIIIILICIAIGCFYMTYWVIVEPGDYKVLGNEKYFIGSIFFILSMISLIIAIDLYFYFNNGIHYIIVFLKREM